MLHDKYPSGILLSVVKSGKQLTKFHGPLVKRLRLRFFTPASRVRLPDELMPLSIRHSTFSWPIGQAVKTPVFHTGIQGSTP